MIPRDLGQLWQVQGIGRMPATVPMARREGSEMLPRTGPALGADTATCPSRAGGLRHDPGDPRRSDIDLRQREITVHGKGGKDRIVRIGHQAARSLDRYILSRSRHEQAWRQQLWLGAGSWEPLTAAGIYQMIARRGQQCGVDAYPHRFRHHFSHTWLDLGGPEGDLLELNGWASPQMLRRQRPHPPHLRPHHDRHLRTPVARSRQHWP
jgi:integrase